MDKDVFKEKYGNLNTYTKFIQKIIELDREANRLENENYVNYLSEQLDKVPDLCNSLLSRVNSFKKFGEKNKQLDDKDIQSTKEFHLNHDKMRDTVSNLFDICKNVYCNAPTSDKAKKLNNEKEELIKCLQGQFFANSDKLPKGFNARNFNSEIIFKVLRLGYKLEVKNFPVLPDMENAYKTVMKDLLKAEKSKMDEYKDYKNSQKDINQAIQNTKAVENKQKKR